jgi:hypothetical protein
MNSIRPVLRELNTYLRSFPPSHAATADGCVVKHKIECTGNSDGTFHLEARAPVRQIGDRAIDQRVMTFEDDARSLESAAARFISALLLRVIRFDLPATRHGGLGGQPCAKRSVSPSLARMTLRLRYLVWSSARSYGSCGGCARRIIDQFREKRKCKWKPFQKSACTELEFKMIFL